MCEATFKLNQAVRIFISSRLTIWLYLQELSDKGCDFFWRVQTSFPVDRLCQHTYDNFVSSGSFSSKQGLNFTWWSFVVSSCLHLLLSLVMSA